MKTILATFIAVVSATELHIDVLIGEGKGYAIFDSETNGDICLDETRFHDTEVAADAFCLKVGKQDDRQMRIIKNSITDRGFTLMMCL